MAQGRPMMTFSVSHCSSSVSLWSRLNVVSSLIPARELEAVKMEQAQMEQAQTEQALLGWARPKHPCLRAESGSEGAWRGRTFCCCLQVAPPIQASPERG